jgi:hypothetical protein
MGSKSAAFGIDVPPTKALSKTEHPSFNPALYDFNPIGSINIEDINSLSPGDIRMWTQDLLEP